jgi:hypothetical protein
MTLTTYKCDKCGNPNEIQSIDDISDIPDDDLKRVRKYVEWMYSSQSYEQYWDDDKGQMCSTYERMLEEPDFADDIRLFCEHVIYTNWMDKALKTIREEGRYYFPSDYQVMGKALELYREAMSSFVE